MLPMPIADLHAISKELADTGKRVKVLWQEPETLLFVARGREYRSEFHLNPSSEVMYMIKGQMNLHYRDVDNDNKEGAHVLKEGDAIYTAPLIPHSPRFPPDAFLLVQERKRHPGEIDRFHWYCPECDAFLHEETFVVEDYTKDPVSRAYSNFFDVEAHRTCTSCGHIMPAPSGI